MTENKRDKIIAAAITALVCLLTVTGLVTSSLTYPPKGMKIPDPEEEAEIFFADIEYKEIKSNPTPTVDGQPASAAASEVSGDELQDVGSGEVAPPLVASTTPQPAKQEKPKTEEVKKPAGPTQEELNERSAAAIRARMGKATNLDKNTEGSGTASDGKASTGNNPGADGLGLDGRKLLTKADPGIKNASGKVWVRISVNADGAVTSASVVRSSGFGSREAEVRAACESASRKLRYTADSSKSTQSGTITWNIK
jgi:TonB family protein